MPSWHECSISKWISHQSQFIDANFPLKYLMTLLLLYQRKILNKLELIPETSTLPLIISSRDRYCLSQRLIQCVYWLFQKCLLCTLYIWFYETIIVLRIVDTNVDCIFQRVIKLERARYLLKLDCDVKVPFHFLNLVLLLTSSQFSLSASNCIVPCIQQILKMI